MKQNITFTLKDFNIFRDKYNKAKADKLPIFTFDSNEYLTADAEHILTYLESKFITKVTMVINFKSKVK